MHSDYCVVYHTTYVFIVWYIRRTVGTIASTKGLYQPCLCLLWLLVRRSKRTYACEHRRQKLHASEIYLLISFLTILMILQKRCESKTHLGERWHKRKDSFVGQRLKLIVFSMIFAVLCWLCSGGSIHELRALPVRAERRTVIIYV